MSTAARLMAGVLLLSLPGMGTGQEEPKTIYDYYNAYVAAYEAGDYEAYLENLEGARTLRPEHPTLAYNLAGAHALLGDSTAAYRHLEILARGGLSYPAAADSDFVSLWPRPRFKTLARSFEANAEPRGRCAEEYTLPERGLILESVALDPDSGRMFLSSVRARKIMVVRDGVISDFSAPGDSLWGVFGLKIDSPRGLLWACTGVVPQMQGFREDINGMSALVGYDLEDGSLRYRLDVPADGAPHLVGDVLVASDGSLYATDSYTPRLYRVSPALDSLTVFAELEGFVSPQGLDTDGRGTLYVADYLNGLLALDLATGAQTSLAHDPDIIVFGIDGLYWHDGGLIAVQNGVNPHRVVRYRLQGNRIASASVLAAAQPGFEEPTLGLVQGQDFLFVGSSQWGAYDRAGNPVPDLELVPHTVFRLTLP